MNKDDAVTAVREGAERLSGSDLGRRLNHVADAIEKNEIGDPQLWDGV